MCVAASSLTGISLRTRPRVIAISTSIRHTLHLGIVIFFLSNACIQDINGVFENSLSPDGLPLRATSKKSKLASLRVSSTGGTSRTSAHPGALDRADDIHPLCLMIVGSPFNRGHLHFQASFPWLLLWHYEHQTGVALGDSIFFLSNACIQHTNGAFENLLSPVGLPVRATSTKSKLASLLGAGARAGACALFAVSSTGGSSRTSAPPGALDRDDDIPPLL